MRILQVGGVLLFFMLTLVGGCGGGGGGGGGGDSGAATGGGGGGGTGGGGVQTSGLVPAAPALGATLQADAATLRPLRDQAVWSYRGTVTAFVGAVPVNYTTATTQSVAANGSVTEAFSNGANDGADTQQVQIAGGVVSSPLVVDFAGRGVSETIQIVELRSPLRQGDQYTLLDKRYADTNIDADADGRTDALDVAIYARVAGNEVLTLPDLPPLAAVRVDTVLATRVLLSRTGTFGATVFVTSQTWYAAGIGVVRQRLQAPTASGNSTETIEEVLSAWDGVSTGFGTLPRRLPSSAELAGQSVNFSNAQVFAYPGHALVMGRSASDSSAMLATRFDLRGRVLGSLLLRDFRTGSSARMVQMNDGPAMLDEPPEGSSTRRRLTLFNTDGSLRGAVGAISIELGGGRQVTSVMSVAVAGDGERFWLLWLRMFRDTDPAFSIRFEVVLRPYDRQGQPLADERIVDLPEPLLPTIVARNGQVLLSWTGPAPGYDRGVSYLDPTSGRLLQRVVFAGLPGSNGFLQPLLLDSGGALLWSSPLGGGGVQDFGAGVRLDAGFAVLRSGSTLASEQISGLPTFDGGASALGSRLVFTSPDAGSVQPPPAESVGLSRVSWLDAAPSAPLNSARLNSVRFPLFSPAAQAVYADRVLVFGADADVTVVWLNSGPGS